MLLAVVTDPRLVLVRLAEQLRRMRRARELDEAVRLQLAWETREIYAPLASRLGIWQLKWELEDLSLRALEPDHYKAIAGMLDERRLDRQHYIESVVATLKRELAAAGIKADVTGRPKHLWSIEQKIKRRGKPFDEIYDLMAIRVIVASVPECYHVLGIIHHNWTPLQERIKDYIASPKSNAYQSLHTTIFGPGGELFEVQIRTREMHRTAEYGIAAHWVYKNEGGKADDELDHALGWFRQLLELQQDTHTPEEFLEFLKVDLYQDEIFMFTPKGDVKRLPKGATPIDFAFHVHTEVGLKCQGAKINGRIAPLHRELKNGDTVEILTSPHARPSRDWLNHVHTARARHKIKQWIREEEETVSLQMGREILARETRRRRLDPPTPEQLEQGATALGLHSGTALEVAIGRGDVAIGQVFRVLFPDRPPDELQEPKPTVFGRLVDRIRLGRGIKIHGVDGLMVRYAQCCQPVPGDPVTGYVTQGRGISIHRADCPNLLALSTDGRRVEIDWQEVEGEAFSVRLALSGEDRRGLYADIMSAISATGTNIRSADIHTKDGTVFGTVFVEVDNIAHLGKVLKAVRRVKGVFEVERREAPGTQGTSAAPSQ